jgi:hypothetical protein
MRPYKFFDVEVFVTQWLIVVNSILDDEHLEQMSARPQKPFCENERPDIYLLL